MFKVTKYPQGTFCWADGQSTDQAKAKDFYAAVMGWDYEDIPMGEGMTYTMFSFEGENVAGLGQMQKELQDMGVPSMWNSYISVDNVDSFVGKINELGGKIIMEPIDVFDSGRMLYLEDPTGAAVGLWQPKNHIGSGLVNKPGAMTWNELSTRDSAAARKFFEALFGWEFTKDENMDYLYFKNNGRSNGGIIQMTEEWGDMPPHWMVYFSVANLDESLEKVKANGGSVPMDPMEAPNVGRFAVISDPAGAHCTLIQSTNPETWED